MSRLRDVFYLHRHIGSLDYHSLRFRFFRRFRHDRFYPLRTHIAARWCDKTIVFASENGEVPLAVQLTQITCAPGSLCGALTEVAVHQSRAIDNDFARIYSNGGAIDGQSDGACPSRTRAASAWTR